MALKLCLYDKLAFDFILVLSSTRCTSTDEALSEERDEGLYPAFFYIYISRAEKNLPLD